MGQAESSQAYLHHVIHNSCDTNSNGRSSPGFTYDFLILLNILQSSISSVQWSMRYLRMQIMKFPNFSFSFSPLVIIQNVVNRMRKILLPKRRNISLFIKVCKIWQPVIQAESSQLKLDPAVVAAGWCEAKGGLVWKPILGFSGPDIRVAWPGPDHWW